MAHPRFFLQLSTGFSASLNTHASRLLRVTPQFSE